LVAAVGFFLAAFITDMLGLKPPLIGFTYVLIQAAVGAGIWFFAKTIEDRPGQVLIDKTTGHEITIRPNAGSLFFIPTRYWAFIIPGLSAMILLLPPSH
jgi:hypothetical protein